MKNNNKKVYVGMCADILHTGHLSILDYAAQLGEVHVGLLTDEAMTSYKRKPVMPYADRERIVKSLKQVSKVLPQKTLSYSSNLEVIKPDFVVHGDDWAKGVQSEARKEVIEKLKEWHGKLIEVPYTKNISTSKIIELVLKSN